MRPLLLTACLALALAACDTAGPAPDDADGLRVAEIVLTTPAGDVVAYSHDDHWHGTIRGRVGQDVVLHAWVVPQGSPDVGHDTPPRATWQRLSEHAGHAFRVTSDNEAAARWSVQGDVLTLEAREPGTALTTVVVLRGTTTRYQSPPAPTISSVPPPALTAAPAARH
ncbi:MAG: hypothetical protein ACK41D_04060 [Rubricoccaceae bacterium]